MQLLLIRHAIAFERDPSRWPDDSERPLSPRGHARARKAAAGLGRLMPRPSRVLTSPFKRTRQTARILARAAGWPAAVNCPQLAPGTSAPEVLRILARQRGARIVAVGHEPSLSDLLTHCLQDGASGGSLGFKKMGAALVAFRHTAEPGRGRLVWFLPPRILRAAAR